jgi:ComF family protein
MTKTQTQISPHRSSSWWDNFVALLFPRLCLACDEPLPFDEPYLCFECQVTLPETDFHLHKNNDFTDKLTPFFPVQSAAALFYFTKKSRTQHLIHRIKYHDKREVAIELGKWLGKKMLEQPHFQEINCVIPVPMHPTKLRFRGYNQAEMFALGIQEATNWAVETSVLRKTKMTESQTRKSRLARSQNVEEVFTIGNATPILNKSILLVDDVMTTGATLDACAEALLKAAPNTKISVATIAFARR